MMQYSYLYENLLGTFVVLTYSLGTVEGGKYVLYKIGSERVPRH